MILNKNESGALELKGLLGFIYKSNKFENLVSYIEFAQREVLKMIGKEVFKLAEDHYNSENYNLTEEDNSHPEYPLLDELVRKIQLPVALHAYRRFAPSSDLTHSDKGRQIFVSDTEKPAFEWQVVRDNENILALAYEAMDILIEFIDSQPDSIAIEVVGSMPQQDFENPIAEAWGTSDAFVKMRKSFITMEEFNEIFPINSSMRLFIALSPFIIKVQNKFVMPNVTEQKFIELKESMMDKDLTPDQKKLISMIHPVIVFFTMSLALKSLAVETLPEGIFQNYTGNVIAAKNTASRMDRLEVSARLEKLGHDDMKRLQEYIRKFTAEASGTIYYHEDPLERFKPDDKFVRF